MLETLTPLLITLFISIAALEGLKSTLKYLSARDARRQESISSAEKKYVDERIAEIDKALGKTLAPILDDIGQIRTKMNIEKYM